MNTLFKNIINSIYGTINNLRTTLSEKGKELFLCARKNRRLIIKSLLIFPGLPFLVLYGVPSIQEAVMPSFQVGKNKAGADTNLAIATQNASLREEIKKLKLKFTALTGNQPYLVINTSKNSFRLFVKRVIKGEGMCSTGSYVLLRNGEKERWLFETPKGLFRVQSKTTSPVWKKPDWAFVEEGLQVPATDDNSRFEYGVLGDYALSLGDGYLIHGTLFQRFLGMPVTHGCIRMNDEDLKLVYNTLMLGSKVYIY